MNLLRVNFIHTHTEPAVDMGEEEFGQALDSESFLDQLKADEAALQEANKLLLVSTPSFTLSHTHTHAKYTNCALMQSIQTVHH